MTSYSKADLDEARRALISTRNKCEKAMPNLVVGSAQQTLLVRRIDALRIAIDLIERELVNSTDDAAGTMR